MADSNPIDRNAGEGRVKRNFQRLVTKIDGVFDVNSIGVGNSAAGTTPGSVVAKIEVFDRDGNSLGFIPVYDAIA